MKNSRLILFGILGGLIGFIIHYSKTHAPTGESVLHIGPHAIEGTIFTLIGIVIGIAIHFILRKK